MENLDTLDLILVYRDKIARILGNRLEYNGDHAADIDAVKTWVSCEWQCGMIEDMSLCKTLLDEVDVIANRMIKEL